MEKKVSPFHFTNMRDYLASELSSRCKSNPKYSLRAFAKALDMDAASLHRILTGQRNISHASFNKISSKLEFDPREIQHFQKEQGPTIQGQLSSFDFAPTEFDTFEVISEWQHLAIMELLATKNFQADEKWIAYQLGITIHEARTSIERLFKTGFLENKKGKWKLSSRHNSFAKDNFTTTARKRLQRTFLIKAIEALDTLPMQERDHSGVTIAIERTALPLLIEKINAFRKEIADFAQKHEKRSEDVYQVSIALFPLTKNQKNNNQKGEK